MDIFRGNTPVIVRRVTAYDEYGQPAVVHTFKTMVKVIKFSDNITPTPLRQEMSASHGRLDDTVGKVVMHFAVKDAITINTSVEVYGTTLSVSGVWPERSTTGALRHLRVELSHQELSSDITS